MKLSTLMLLVGFGTPALAQTTDEKVSTETVDKSANNEAAKEATEEATEEANQQDQTPSDETSTNRTTVEVVLNNGIVLSGTVSTSDAVSWSAGQSLNFAPNEGKPMVIDAGSIKTVRTPTPAAPTGPRIMKASDYRSPKGYLTENRGKSRYLYAPSAIGLKKGEGYYSQKWVFSALAYGVTDNLTLLGGTFTFFPPALTIVGAKASTKVAPNVHIAAGGEVFITTLDDDVSSPAQLAFAGATFGDSDAQLSLTSGYVSLGVDGLGPSAFPLVISGQLRTAERGVLVSENWLLLVTRGDEKDNFQNSQAFIASLAYRILGPAWSKWSLDLGLVTFGDGLDDAIVPLPWIDFAYHFGGKK